MAIIDKMPRSATVQALEDCVLLTLTTGQIAHRIESADPVVRLILDVLLTRFRDTLSGLGAGSGAANGLAATAVGPVPTVAVHRIEALAQITLVGETEDRKTTRRFELLLQPNVTD